MKHQAKYEQHIAELCAKHNVRLLTWDEVKPKLGFRSILQLTECYKADEAFGCCHPSERWFYLNAELTRWDVYLTALHEIGHCVNGWVYGDLESDWHVEKLAWDWAINEFRGILWPCKLRFIADSLKSYEKTKP